MSATAAIKAARTAGIRLGIDGDALTLEAATAPPAAVLDQLAHHKAGVMTLLRPGKDGWSGDDWMAFFDERAQIVEFDGGLTPDQAEARAFACCVAEWLKTAIQFCRRPVAVSAAMAASKPTTSCCRSAPNRPATLGCIRVAGKHGIQDGRTRST